MKFKKDETVRVKKTGEIFTIEKVLPNRYLPCIFTFFPPNYAVVVRGGMKVYKQSELEKL